MAILQSCCCWRSLRKGAYASAVYTMAYFSVTVSIMGFFVRDEWETFKGERMEPASSSILEPSMSRVTVYFNLVLLVWGCLGWLSCIILIAGIYSDTKYLLIPWVFVVSGMMLLDLCHTLFLLFSGSTKFEPLTAILFTLDFFNMSLQTYSILCVVSLYQEYKAGRGTADFEYVNRRVPGVRYAPQPTGTSFLSTRRAVTYHETRTSPTGSPPQDVRTASRKHVQFGDDRTWLAPPAPSVIHIESPKDSVSSELNGRSGASPSEEGNSSGEWPGLKAVVDTQPLIRHVKSTSQMSI